MNSNIADSLQVPSTNTNKKQPQQRANNQQHHNISVASTSTSTNASAVVYESQISPELEGIKLKIKKSPTQDLPQVVTQNKAPRSRAAADEGRKAGRGRKAGALTGAGRGRKRIKRKKGDSENEPDEEEAPEDFVNYSRVSATAAAEDKNRAQSIWAGERMPPEILTRIFMEVTYTEGCVPTLVR